jgi:hypothetical protein
MKVLIQCFVKVKILCQFFTKNTTIQLALIQDLR